MKGPSGQLGKLSSRKWSGERADAYVNMLRRPGLVTRSDGLTVCCMKHSHFYFSILRQCSNKSVGLRILNMQGRSDHSARLAGKIQPDLESKPERIDNVRHDINRKRGSRSLDPIANNLT